MSRIRVVWGTASAPTALASYDAALAEAGIHDFNLVGVSSVIPAETPVEAVGTAPELGDPGDRLTVVEARATTAGPGRAAACLGWTGSDDGPGLFYEASGESQAATERRVRDGLAAGRDLRGWSFPDEHLQTAVVDADDGQYATAVVVAAYGRGEAIL